LVTADHVVISATGVHKSFRRDAEVVHALRGAELAIRTGEVVGISGASGSGKSTLLAVLCGWEAPDEGTVAHVAGTVSELSWSELALVPQTLGLLEDLTIFENLELPARLVKRISDFAERTEELATLFGITHLVDRYPHQVSLGEQQRCAFARAMLLRPGLVLADEPTAHQDQAWAEVMLAAITRRANEGGAFVLVTHSQHVLDYADRVLTMSDGTLA
jgi:ABC-type lipoprotein export system ATPase subunit